MVGTVLVSVSGYRVVDEALCLVEPHGQRVQRVVGYDDVVGMIVQMTSSPIVDMDVVELGDERVAVAYDYDLSHLLKFPRINRGHRFGWLYVVEPNPADSEAADAVARLEDMLMTANNPRVILSNGVRRQLDGRMDP